MPDIRKIGRVDCLDGYAQQFDYQTIHILEKKWNLNLF
jgi:hypothetical protein